MLNFLMWMWIRRSLIFHGLNLDMTFFFKKSFMSSIDSKVARLRAVHTKPFNAFSPPHDIVEKGNGRYWPHIMPTTHAHAVAMPPLDNVTAMPAAVSSHPTACYVAPTSRVFLHVPDLVPEYTCSR